MPWMAKSLGSNLTRTRFFLNRTFFSSANFLRLLLVFDLPLQFKFYTLTSNLLCFFVLLKKSSAQIISAYFLSAYWPNFGSLQGKHNLRFPLRSFHVCLPIGLLKSLFFNKEVYFQAHWKH